VFAVPEREGQTGEDIENIFEWINRRCKRGLIGETIIMVSIYLPFPKGKGKLEKILKISSNGSIVAVSED
jgi:hypothetical protein